MSWNAAAWDVLACSGVGGMVFLFMEFVGCPAQTGGVWLLVQYRRSGDFLTLWGEKPVRTSLNPLALDKAPPTSKMINMPSRSCSCLILARTAVLH